MMYKFLHAINIPIHVQEVSVLVSGNGQASAAAAALPRRLHHAQAASLAALQALPPSM
jgi:hypothetical protein